jgi:hypothetical protein
MRKRNRKVKLTNRIGSRRNKSLLVAIFCLLGAAIWVSGVGVSQPGEDYLVASSDLSSFTQLTDQTTHTITLDLKEEAQHYIPAGSKMASWFVSQPVRAGQLIPLSAVTPSSIMTCTPMKLALGMTLNSSIHKGDLIDVWAGESSSTDASVPVQIVSSASLLNVSTATDALSQSIQTVELCVNASEIRAVVSAIAQKLTVIAVQAQ